MSGTAKGAIRRLPGASALSRRLDRALRWRIDEAVQPLRHELADLQQAAGDSSAALSEVRRMAPQLAAVEERLAGIGDLLDHPGPASDGERAEAIGLIAEIRQEHTRIRARMTAISWYEDRLRQTEQRIRVLEGADPPG